MVVRRRRLEGAGAGAVTGLLIGLFLALFTLWEPLVSWIALMLWWALIGAVVGSVLGLLSHALNSGRRDFSSVASMQPSSFDVLVEAAHAQEAQRITQRRPSGRPRR